MIDSAACSICGFGFKDCLHATVECNHAAALAEAMGQWWQLPDVGDLRSLGEEWLFILMDKYDNSVMANFLMVMWRAWHVRNSVTQAGGQISIEGSAVFLKGGYMDSLCMRTDQGGAERGKHTWDPGTTISEVRRHEGSWVPPPMGMLKVNVDGAYNHGSGKAALGVVIRDERGNPVLTAWRVIFRCKDAEEAEALACLAGIQSVNRWPEKPIILESDCSQLIGKIT